MEAAAPLSANKRRIEAEEPTSSCTNTPPNIKSNKDGHKEQLKFQDAFEKASHDCDWCYVYKRPVAGVGQTVVEHRRPPAAVTQTLWEYYSCDTREPDFTFINDKPEQTHFMPIVADVNLNQLIDDSLDEMIGDSLDEKNLVADGALRGRWRAFLKSRYDPLRYGCNRFDAQTLMKIKNFVATACNSFFCVGTRGQDLVLDIAMMECSRYFFGGVFLTAFVEWWVNWEKGDFEMAIPDFKEQAHPYGVRESVKRKRTYAVFYVLRYLKRVHAAFKEVQKLRDSALDLQLPDEDGKNTITNERLVRFSERLTDFLTISLVDSYEVNYAAYNVYTLLVSTMAGFGTAVYDMMMPTISLLTTGGFYRYLMSPYEVCALNYSNNTTTDRERRDAVRLNPAAKTVMREMSRSNEVNFAWGLMEALRWMFERDLFVEYFATQVFIMEPLMYQEWEGSRTSLLETVRMEDRWRDLLTCSPAAMDRLVAFRTEGNHNNAHSYLFALLMIDNEKSSTELKERPDELVFKVVQYLLQLVWGPNSSRGPLDLLLNMIHTLENFTSTNTTIARYWVDCFWMLSRYVDVGEAREEILRRVLFQSGAMGAVKLWMYQLLLGLWVYHLRMDTTVSAGNASGRNLPNDQGKLTRITIVLNMARMLRNRSLTVLPSYQFEYDPDPQQDDLNDRIAAVQLACVWSEKHGYSDYCEANQTDKTMFDYRDRMLLRMNPQPETTDPVVTLHQAIVDRMLKLGPCDNAMFQFINKTDLMEPLSLNELEESRDELNRRWDAACASQADGSCPESVPRTYHDKWEAKNRGAAICPDNRIGEPITTYERGWNKVMPGMTNVTAYLDWKDVDQDPSGNRCDDAGNPLYPPVWRMCHVKDNKMYMSAPQRKRRPADAADAATVGRPVSFSHSFEAEWVDEDKECEPQLEQEGESVDGEDVSRRGASFIVGNMRYTWMRDPVKQNTKMYIRRCWTEWSSPPVLLSSEGLLKPHLDTSMIDDSCPPPYTISPDDPQPEMVKSSDLCMKTTWTYNTTSVRGTIIKSSDSWTYNTPVPYVMSDWHSRRVPTQNRHDSEAFHPIPNAVLADMEAMTRMGAGGNPNLTL